MLKVGLSKGSQRPTDAAFHAQRKVAKSVYNDHSRESSGNSAKGTYLCSRRARSFENRMPRNSVSAGRIVKNDLRASVAKILNVEKV